nr:terminase gpA endonuclease subunit [Endozoicomonas sp. SESOKO2]
MRKYKHGVAYFEWDARKKRNETLDCRVYALTAVRILQQHRGLNLEQLAAQRPEPEIILEASEPETLTRARSRRFSRSSYLNG